MSENLHSFDPESEAGLDTLLSGYANVDPPADAAARWQRSLRTAPRRERCLGLSARTWAAACALCLAGMLVLAGAVWQRRAAPVPQIVFAPPAPPPAVVSASAPARAVRPPLTPPPDTHAVHPTAQERLLVRLVADQPGVLTQLFARSVFEPVTALDDATATGENQ